MIACSSLTESILIELEKTRFNQGLIGFCKIISLMALMFDLGSCQSQRVSQAGLTIFDGSPAVSAGFDGVVGFAVNFGDNDQFILDCSGVLVHPKLILTAAHCVETWAELAPTVEDFRRRVRVYTGAGAPGGLVRPQWEIDTAGVHPDYASERLGRADLAYIVLKQEMKGVKPLRIVSDGAALTKILKAGVEVSMAGFGHQTERYDKQRYGLKMWRKGIIKDSKGGAIELVGSSDLAGKGDSGGPLLISVSQNEFAVLGILSHGVQGDSGTTYALIAPSLEWILNQTRIQLN